MHSAHIEPFGLCDFILWAYCMAAPAYAFRLPAQAVRGLFSYRSPFVHYRYAASSGYSGLPVGNVAVEVYFTVGW